MHQTLLSFYPHDSSDASKPKPSRTTSTRPEKFSNRGCILALSLPTQTVEPPLLKVITTYLLYTLTAYALSLFTTNTDQLEHFAEILKTSPTILNWIPYCHSLPKENVDSLCTRSYTALTKQSSLGDQLSPRALFDIRTYSLRCLLHASPSITQPDVFWDQSIKFGLGFIKGNKGDESSLSQTVMTSFSSLVVDAQQREDWDSFSSCKGFLQFCEYWMGFAKRVFKVIFFVLRY
jgi:separase